MDDRSDIAGTPKGRDLTRGERQARALKNTWRGFSIADVILVIIGFAFVMQRIIGATMERGVMVPLSKQIVAMVVVLVFCFLFEAAYQINVAFMFGVPFKRSRSIPYARFKWSVALGFLVWVIVRPRQETPVDLLAVFTLLNIAFGTQAWFAIRRAKGNKA